MRLASIRAVHPCDMKRARCSVASALLVASALFLGTCACCLAAPAPDFSQLASVFSSPSNSTTIVNVVSFGASGDGASDDTAAFVAALAFLLSQPALARGGVLYVPAGAYRITSALIVPTSGAFTLQGDGWVSQIIWDTSSNLFQWPSSNPASNMLIQDIMVVVPSSWASSSTPLFAFSFPAGLTQSLIRHIKIYNPNKGGGVSGIDMGLVSDTNEVVSCVLWLLTGVGIRIGKGSEIRISGGRVISLGPLASPAGSIGIHVTGNNGGVHVVSTDVIGWNSGIVLDSSNGQGSNREIFINQATIDSNSRGLAVYDNSYIDVTGCWAASSVTDNIWTDPSSNPQLVIVGGTMYEQSSRASRDVFEPIFHIQFWRQRRGELLKIGLQRNHFEWRQPDHDWCGSA